MQVAVERRPGSKVALTITVEPEVVQQHMEQLFQKYARRVTVPGFRPGKAPRKMLEERVNRHLVEQEAIDAVIDTTYKQALSEQQLEPLERGEVTDLNAGEDKSLTYTVLVSVRPEVTLGQYTGLEIMQDATKITDEQVNAEIERLLERTADFAEVEDGIQTGDYVTIDYTMKVDGEDYPEGNTEGYPLEVGSDTFFPELNEGLLGVKKGETTTVSTTYADDYSNAELAGKTATFDITVQQVRRMVKPEANDEWVETVTQGSLATTEELRERIMQNLQAMAVQSDRESVRNAIVSKVVEGAELDIPDTLVEEEFEHLMQEFEQRLSQERMTLEDYAEAMNRTTDDIRGEHQIIARDMVRRSLVLQEVARREKILVTDADIDNALQMYAFAGKSVKALRKDLEKSGRMGSLVSRIFHEKVLSFLESNANIQIEGLPVAAEEAPAADAPSVASEEQSAE